MDKCVGRDAHKMTAFVRFKEVGRDFAGRAAEVSSPGSSRIIIIVARKAPFFQRRFNDMDWLIATPKGSAAWDGEKLTVNDESCGEARSHAIADR